MKKTTKIDYELFIQNAMRQAIRDLLSNVSKSGLPGNHYFYIDFLTQFPGVHISETLKSEYPEDMMISIQYDYFDLVVEKDYFSVTLIFDEDEERITIPFAAIIRFSDPSVDFGIEFSVDVDRYELPEVLELLSELEDKPTILQEDDNNIISFDRFKKKTNSETL